MHRAPPDSIRRKEIIGTVEEHPTKASAQKACEFRRSTINRETRTPRTIAEMVDHYTEKELPNKTPYTREVYAGYISKWITPKWGSLHCPTFGLWEWSLGLAL